MTADTSADASTASPRLFQWVRLVQLLSAGEHAGMAPIPSSRLHVFAYLANVMSPVWDLTAIDGKLLKRHRGPFYPELQWDLDRLVGMGVVEVRNLKYSSDRQRRWRLDATYSLTSHLGLQIAKSSNDVPSLQRIYVYLCEIAYALTTISEDDQLAAIYKDATYGDERTSEGLVVDFDEYQIANYTRNAVEWMAKGHLESLNVSPAERIALYIRYLKRSAHAAA